MHGENKVAWKCFSVDGLQWYHCCRFWKIFMVKTLSEPPMLAVQNQQATAETIFQARMMEMCGMGQIEKQVAKGDFNLNPTEDGHHSIQQLLYTGFAEYNNQQTVFSKRCERLCCGSPEEHSGITAQVRSLSQLKMLHMALWSFPASVLVETIQRAPVFTDCELSVQELWTVKLKWHWFIAPQISHI